MPAVSLTEVQERARNLFQAWRRNPAALPRALEYTWQRYGFQGQRVSKSQPADDLPTYHVPPAALHLLAQTWNTLLDDPATRSAFLDALWDHRVVESRHVAVLTWATQRQFTGDDITRFWEWYQASAATPTLRRALLEYMAPQLVQQLPQAYARALFQRLDQAKEEDLALLLPLLPPLLAYTTQDWFPQLRVRLTRWLSPPGPSALPEWSTVLLELFRRWPGETLPWLRHLAYRYPSPHWSWLLRRLYPWLPSPWRERVRQLARELPASPSPS